MSEQTIKCAKCAALLAVPGHSFEVVDGRELSVVVCRHVHEITCPACGVRMVAQIEKVEIEVGFKVQEKAKRPLIIHPPSFLGVH